GQQVVRRAEGHHAAEREQRQREDLGLHAGEGLLGGQGVRATGIAAQRRPADERTTRLDGPVGDQQQSEQTQREQRAPQEQRGGVHRKRAGRRFLRAERGQALEVTGG